MRNYIHIIKLLFLFLIIIGCNKEEEQIMLNLLITPAESIEANGKSRVKLEALLETETKFSGNFWFSTKAGLFSNQKDTIAEIAIGNKATTFLTVGTIEGDFDIEVCFKNSVGQICEEQIIQLAPNSAFKDYSMSLSHQGTGSLIADSQSKIAIQITSNTDHANEVFTISSSEGVFSQTNNDSLMGRLNDQGGFTTNLQVGNNAGDYFITFSQDSNNVQVSNSIEVGYSLPTITNIITVSTIPKNTKTVKIQLELQKDFGEVSNDIQVTPIVKLIEANDTLSNIGTFSPALYRTANTDSPAPIEFDFQIQDTTAITVSTGKLAVLFQMCYQQDCFQTDVKLIDVE